MNGQAYRPSSVISHEVLSTWRRRPPFVSIRLLFDCPFRGGRDPPHFPRSRVVYSRPLRQFNRWRMSLTHTKYVAVTMTTHSRSPRNWLCKNRHFPRVATSCATLHRTHLFDVPSPGYRNVVMLAYLRIIVDAVDVMSSSPKEVAKEAS